MSIFDGYETKEELLRDAEAFAQAMNGEASDLAKEIILKVKGNTYDL